jgi:hypothetical protein
MDLLTNFNVNVHWDEKDNKVRFTLLDNYTFHIDGETINVPSGYQTDFATVPRILWSILPPLGKHNPAALIHDYLYDNRIGTRKKADKIFLNVMLLYNVKVVTAYIMYLGVRIGGRRWWIN